MFIKNIEMIDTKKVYISGKLIGEWLINHGIPLLSKKNDIYYFAITEELMEVKKQMPLYLKLIEMM